MKVSSIKEAFGGEVAFTKYIANNKDVSTRLLDVIDNGMGELYTVAPEDGTVDGKRVDLVVRDEDNNVVQVIESQDSSGWLDSIHASKIAYYCYEKDCMDAILLTEDADEHIKGFVRWYNENTPLNIFLICSRIYQTSAGPYVDFIPIMRPYSLKEKKIQRKPGASNNGDNFAEFLTEKFNEYPGKFVNKTDWYVSSSNVGGTGITIGIHPRKSGYYLIIFSGKKYQGNTVFADSLAKHLPADEIKFLQTQANVRRTTWEEALEVFDIVENGLKSKAIAVK